MGIHARRAADAPMIEKTADFLAVVQPFLAS
jgi:hypothetical protein